MNRGDSASPNSLATFGIPSLWAYSNAYSLDCDEYLLGTAVVAGMRFVQLFLKSLGNGIVGNPLPLCRVNFVTPDQIKIQMNYLTF